jgi:hypothetical protein
MISDSIDGGLIELWIAGEARATHQVRLALGSAQIVIETAARSMIAIGDGQQCHSLLIGRQSAHLLKLTTEPDSVVQRKIDAVKVGAALPIGCAVEINT